MGFDLDGGDTGRIPTAAEGFDQEDAGDQFLTLQDRALAPKLQRKNISALGGVQTLIEIDTCHCLMVSEPERLAEILVERCRLYV